MQQSKAGCYHLVTSSDQNPAIRYSLDPDSLLERLDPVNTCLSAPVTLSISSTDVGDDGCERQRHLMAVVGYRAFRRCSSIPVTRVM